MRVHHVDCASLCPFGRSALHGEGRLFERGFMPAHCLILETPSHGIVLVDTGFGENDVLDPRGQLGLAFSTLAGVQSERVTTMRAHLRRLGLDPNDVRHVVVTHLDLDHAGGLPDFPNATVHVHADEHRAALSPAWRERQRYRASHWDHGPRWQTYTATGERWRGFEAVRELRGLPPEILAIPMAGHSRGHWLVAIETAEGPLVHCGDAYFHRASIEGGLVPWGVRAFERLVAVDGAKVEANHGRLRELARTGGGIRLFCAHDQAEMQRFGAS